MANIVKKVKDFALDSVMKSLEGKNPKTATPLLNLVMPHVIPFNRPLGLRIKKLSLSSSEVELPFRRGNQNHLGGLHACALATIGEYTAGLLLLRRMDPAKQRLVLKTLRADYSKQGRATALAVAEWPEAQFKGVADFKTSEETHDIEMLTTLYGSDRVELARITTLWQVKPWAKVRKGS